MSFGGDDAPVEVGDGDLGGGGVEGVDAGGGSKGDALQKAPPNTPMPAPRGGAEGEAAVGSQSGTPAAAGRGSLPSMRSEDAVSALGDVLAQAFARARRTCRPTRLPHADLGPLIHPSWQPPAPAADHPGARAAAAAARAAAAAAGATSAAAVAAPPPPSWLAAARCCAAAATSTAAAGAARAAVGALQRSATGAATRHAPSAASPGQKKGGGGGPLYHHAYRPEHIAKT